MVRRPGGSPAPGVPAPGRAAPPPPVPRRPAPRGPQGAGRLEAGELGDADQMELSQPPYGHVEDCMRDADYVACVSPDDSLAEARRVLRAEGVSGVPVVRDDGTVVGVLSRKDLRPLWKRRDHREAFERTLVSEVMSTPPVTVRPHAHLAEAAGVMLGYRVYRLPVVDKEGRLLGLVSRADLFQPLVQSRQGAVVGPRRMQVNVGGDVGWSGGRASMSLDLEEWEESLDETGWPAQEGAAWTVKYLYDGDCRLCRLMRDTIARNDKRGAVLLVNIADPDYAPELNEGISYEDAMRTIHAVSAEGHVLTGTLALETLYEAAGLGWVTKAMRLPVLSQGAGLLYKAASALRLPLDGRSMDALLAARRLRSAEVGDEDFECGSLEDEEDCEVPLDW